MRDQDLFQVTFVDLQPIINSIGSTEVKAKEFAASPGSWDLPVVPSTNNSSFQAGGFRANLGQFWSKSSSGIVLSVFRSDPLFFKLNLVPECWYYKADVSIYFFKSVKNSTDAFENIEDSLSSYSKSYFKFFFLKNKQIFWFSPRAVGSILPNSITEGTPLNQDAS